jgi:hypothetical protein
MKITRTQHGFNWDDMELSCLFDDNQGRVFMQIKRGKKTHELYVTKTGKLVIRDASKKEAHYENHA